MGACADAGPWRVDSERARPPPWVFTDTASWGVGWR
eukprot:CAMPEP_0206043164 /NCGR_PEP_ID=MMETSP1466-20131121/7957_1 /ASSEMBLY_ACC=CAM_ASM_001126 /TAXON_ID=44452 /ORGANISM="Pavlova gyrans, Strain CCMP608" /LENGTH=35 /DNA_ID= /DNA_START= /DNA_END= /DNA_ORIENTATION=